MAPPQQNTHPTYKPPPWPSKPSAPPSSDQDRPPWAKDNFYDDEWTPIDWLSAEIVDFCEYMSPTPKEVQIRQDAVQRLRAVAKHLWKNSTVTLFGSFDVGLALPTSDLDVVIMTNDSDKSEAHLHLLKKELSARKMIDGSPMVLNSARVPIVKYRDQFSGYSMDVSFNRDDGHLGAQITRQYMEAAPVLRPLVMTVKQILILAELNEVFSGGLSSYATMLLCMFFLQISAKKRRTNISEFTDISTLLVDLLEFYSQRDGFDFENLVLTTVGDGLTYRKTAASNFEGMRATSYFSVEDPSDNKNDVTCGTWKVNKMRRLFANAARILRAAMNAWVVNPDSGSWRGSILAKVLNIPAETIRRRRWVEEKFQYGVEHGFWLDIGQSESVTVDAEVESVKQGYSSEPAMTKSAEVESVEVAGRSQGLKRLLEEADAVVEESSEGDGDTREATSRKIKVMETGVTNEVHDGSELSDYEIERRDGEDMDLDVNSTAVFESMEDEDRFRGVKRSLDEEEAVVEGGDDARESPSRRKKVAEREIVQDVHAGSEQLDHGAEGGNVAVDGAGIDDGDAPRPSLQLDIHISCDDILHIYNTRSDGNCGFRLYL